MWIAHFSDLHLTREGQALYGQVDTRAAFLAALARLRDLPLSVELLLISGDLAEGGEAEAYLFLRQALADLPVPVALLSGNHDCRATLGRVFPEQFAAWQGPVLRLPLSQGSLLLLDSSVPGREWGQVDASTLAALEAAAGGPLLVAMHHPPFPVGIPGMDAIACRGSLEAFGQWLAGAAEGLLCGHVHRQVATQFHGVPARVAPSPAHQIALGPRALAYTLEPGGFLLHDWQPGRHLLTHWLPVQAAPLHFYPE